MTIRKDDAPLSQVALFGIKFRYRAGATIFDGAEMFTFLAAARLYRDRLFSRETRIGRCWIECAGVAVDIALVREPVRREAGLP